MREFVSWKRLAEPRDLLHVVGGTDEELLDVLTATAGDQCRILVDDDFERVMSDAAVFEKRALPVWLRSRGFERDLAAIRAARSELPTALAGGLFARILTQRADAAARELETLSGYPIPRGLLMRAIAAEVTADLSSLTRDARCPVIVHDPWDVLTLVPDDRITRATLGPVRTGLLPPVEAEATPAAETVLDHAFYVLETDPAIMYQSHRIGVLRTLEPVVAFWIRCFLAAARDGADADTLSGAAERLLTLLPHPDRRAA